MGDREGATLEVTLQFHAIVLTRWSQRARVPGAQDLGHQLRGIATLDKRSRRHIDVGVKLALARTDGLENTVPFLDTTTKIRRIV